MNGMMSFEELLREELQDDTEREAWERTVLARSVAHQVIKYRMEHRLSQRALASKLGVSQAVVGRLELGDHEPKFSTLSRLSRVLGLRFDIAIHPLNAAGSAAASPVTINRFEADGVALTVAVG